MNNDIFVEFNIVEKDIINDLYSFDSSSQSEFSNFQNIINKKSHDNVVYIEKDYFLLNGDFVFPQENKEYNVGWESEALSNEDGDINVFVEFTFTNVHESAGLHLDFPEYSVPKNFTIFYKKENQIVFSKTINGNVNAGVDLIQDIKSWDCLRIEFSKTNPFQRIRINYICFGINKVFKNNSIISVNAFVPGNIISDYDNCGTFFCELFGEKSDFSFLENLSNNLKNQTKIFVNLKQGTEYDVFACYNFFCFSYDEKQKTANITGYDILYFLGESYYEKGTVYTEGKKLKQWAQDVASDIGINVVLDDYIDMIYSLGYISEVPYREAFRLIAEAGTCGLNVDEEGRVCIIKKAFSDVKTIPDSDIVEGSVSITEDTAYSGIEVNRYGFKKNDKSLEIGRLDDVALTLEPQEIEIVYSVYPVDISTVEVFVDDASGAVIVSKEVFSDKIFLSLKGTSASKTFITITGTPYNVTTLKDKFLQFDNSNVKKIENNFLITSSLGYLVVNFQKDFLKKVNKLSFDTLRYDIHPFEKVFLNFLNKEAFVIGKTLNVSYNDIYCTIEVVYE